MDDAGKDDRPMPAGKELMRLMGRVVANGKMYSPGHRLTTEALATCYEAVAQALEECGRIDLTMVEGVLIVEGKPAEKNDYFINTLGASLADAGVSGLSLVKGMTCDEFGKLFEIMVSGVQVADAEAADLQQTMAEHGIEHAHALNVTYRTITEQEEVVLKGGKKPSDPGGESAETDAEGIGDAVGQITALLKGGVPIDSEKASKKLVSLLLSDPERLARVILDAAAVESRDAMPYGSAESLADNVVARLDQVRRVLWKERSVKSATRKIDLKKKLLLLGKEILSNMGGAVPADPGDEAAISAFIEDMVREAGVKVIASDYAKKRASFAKAEDDFVQQIKAMGVEKADASRWGENVLEDGVTPGDWRALLAKAAVGAALGGAPGAASRIVALLASLDDMISSGRQDAHAINGIMSQVNEQIGALAGETKQKINTLSEQIQQFDDASAGGETPEGSKPKRSLKNLLELLAEILQELSQPVTVLSSVIQMTSAGYLGPVNAQQKETLGLGEESGERAKLLMDTLIKIVGVPKSMKPNKDILRSIEP